MAKKKVIKKENLKDINTDSLQNRINEDKMRLKKLKFAHAMTPLENPMQIRGLRRSIAKLKTELNTRK